MRYLILSVLSCAALLAAQNSVLATVGGKNINSDEISAAFSNIPGMDFEKLPNEEKKKALNQYIDKKLIIESAKKEGIENSKEFKEGLEKIRDELAFDAWMKREFETVKVSDADAKSYFESNKNRFIQPAMLKARHILVKSEEEAKALLKKLSVVPKASRESEFSKVANASTQDPSGKQNGGDLGWFDKGSMVPEFASAAAAMKKGDISKSPVKTQFGWHIIYLSDKKEAKTTSFNEVKEKLKQSLKMEKLKEKIAAKSKELRSKTKVEIKIK